MTTWIPVGDERECCLLVNYSMAVSTLNMDTRGGCQLSLHESIKKKTCNLLSNNIIILKYSILSSSLGAGSTPSVSLN